MRLQTKMLCLLLPIVVVPLLGLGTIASQQLSGISEHRALGQVKALLEQVAEDFHELEVIARANLGLFASAAIMERYLLTEDLEERYALMQPGLLRLLAKYQHAYPEYCQLAVLDRDGMVDTVREVKAGGKACLGSLPESYLTALMLAGDDVHAQIVPAPEGPGARMLIGKRISLRNASTAPALSPPIERGYLVMAVDLARLIEQVARQQVGENGHLYLTTMQGHLLYAPPGAAIIPALEPAELTRAIAGESLRTRASGGVQLVMGTRLFSDLLLMSRLPETDVLAAARQLRWWVVLYTALAVVLSAGLLVAVLRWLVVNRLRHLSHAAEEIGHGNLQVELPVHSGDEIGSLAATFRDMAGNLRSSHKQISYHAYHDELTGLPNRRKFMEELEWAIAGAQRREGRLGLLFLDIDDFKRVNDTLGHHAGDAFLGMLAEAIGGVLRGRDTLAPARELEMLARLGGDEFLILLHNIDDAAAAGKVAQRILDLFGATFDVHGHEFHVGASIGITLYPDDGGDAETLIKHADIAMYHAKALGKHNYQYFDESLNAAAIKRLALENALRKALDNHEMELHYQPLVDIHDGTIIGFESLLRWRHPVQGMVPPDSFIPLAEETGLIVPIGAWVLGEACRQVRRWRDQGFEVHVSVNVSSVQIAKQDLPTLIASCLDEAGIPPAALVIEITESSLMSVRQNAIATLNAIRALGVSISLDDFGTGYSSLSYLRQFPIDTLKIDKSFVRDINLDDGDAAIIRAIVAMGHSLGLEIVAEGVETVRQWEFLRGHGCDIGQGYLFSRPLPAAEAGTLLAQPVVMSQAGKC